MSYRWNGIECDSLKELEALMMQRAVAEPSPLEASLLPHKYLTGQTINALDTIDLNTRAMETLIDLTKCLKIKIGQIFSAKDLELAPEPKYGTIELDKLRRSAREALGEILARKGSRNAASMPKDEPRPTGYVDFWIQVTADVGYALRELRNKRIEIGFEGGIEYARLKRVDNRPGKGAKYLIECPARP